MENLLNFSEPFISVEHLKEVESYQLENKSIVVNIGHDPVKIEDMLLPSMKSVICSNIEISGAESLVLISVIDENYLGNNPKIDTEIITNSWQHVYDIFGVPQLKNIPLWRSEKESIETIEMNLWYAPEGTRCGLHREHNFLEVHTQVYGLGRMQKFHKNDPDSLYQEVYMSPGYTHDPFYLKNGTYPWHQYLADTDCVWLAIEVYRG